MLPSRGKLLEKSLKIKWNASTSSAAPWLKKGWNKYLPRVFVWYSKVKLKGRENKEEGPMKETHAIAN